MPIKSDNSVVCSLHRYTQVPGDHLSVSMCPHRRRWTGGFDAAALLRTKSLFTTALSMPHVQIAIFALGLLQTGFGLHSLSAKMNTVPNAHCAKVGVSLRSAQRQIQAHASEWHFGLLFNGCKVSGGTRSVTETMQVLLHSPTTSTSMGSISPPQLKVRLSLIPRSLFWNAYRVRTATRSLQRLASADGSLASSI